MRDVGLSDSFVYDGDLCLEAYRSYLAGIVSDETILLYMKRYVIMFVRTKYSHLGIEIMSDLMQSICCELWILITKKKLSEGDSSAFHAFINTVMRRTSAKEFNAVYDRPLSDVPYECFNNGWHRDVTPRDVEDRIFLEELPGALTKTVLAQLRFEEIKLRRACSYILDRVLSDKRISYDLLKRTFGMTNSLIKFLTDHIHVLVRIELYELRSYIKFSSPNEKRDILWDGFERSLWTE